MAIFVKEVGELRDELLATARAYLGIEEISGRNENE